MMYNTSKLFYKQSIKKLIKRENLKILIRIYLNSLGFQLNHKKKISKPNFN